MSRAFGAEGVDASVKSAGALLSKGSMGGKPARLLNSTRDGIVVVVATGAGAGVLRSAASSPRSRGGGAPSFSKALRNRSFALALPRCPGRGFFAAKRRGDERMGAGLLPMKPPVLAARSTVRQTSRRSIVMRSL